MKGLLIKDLYVMRQNLKTLLFILVIWGVIFLPREETFIIPMFTMIGSVNMLSLFSYDTQTQWDSFMLSMPVKRSSAALERYVFSAGMTLISGIAAVIIVAAAQLLMHGTITADMRYEIGYSLATGFVLAFLYLAVALPLIYWFGVEKARLLPTVLLGVIFLGFVLVGKADSGSLVLTEKLVSMVIWGCAAATVPIMVISAFISVKIYEKKEF